MFVCLIMPLRLKFKFSTCWSSLFKVQLGFMTIFMIKLYHLRNIFIAKGSNDYKIFLKINQQLFLLFLFSDNLALRILGGYQFIIKFLTGLFIGNSFLNLRRRRLNIFIIFFSLLSRRQFLVRYFFLPSLFIILLMDYHENHLNKLNFHN